RQVEQETKRHLVLYGEYELAVDDKNRMLIPAEVRKSLDPNRDGEAFFLIVGVNRKPWLYPERTYEQRVARLGQDLTPDQDALALDQMMCAMSSRLEWDKQGRVLIPEKALRRTEIGKEITMIGARDHLELWNRQEWEEHR